MFIAKLKAEENSLSKLIQTKLSRKKNQNKLKTHHFRKKKKNNQTGNNLNNNLDVNKKPLFYLQRNEESPPEQYSLNTRERICVSPFIWYC